MTVIRWITNFLFGFIACIVGIYFVASLVTSYYVLTGRLRVGEPFYIDSLTPSLNELLIFQIACIGIILFCIAVRTYFGKKYDFKFLQPKENETT